GFAASAHAVPVINFDQAEGVSAGGTLSYDGEGGVLTGTNIGFGVVRGLNTPANDGVTLTCDSCKLNFTTGENRSEGPDTWLFSGGGDFTLNGTIRNGSDVLAAGDVLSGSFSATSSTPSVSILDSSMAFSAFGFDSKDPNITSFFGLDADSSFRFVVNADSAGGLAIDDNGGFHVDVTNADLDDYQLTTAVPGPGATSLFGLGLGLIGLGLCLRRRRTQTACLAA